MRTNNKTSMVVAFNTGNDKSGIELDKSTVQELELIKTVAQELEYKGIRTGVFLLNEKGFKNTAELRDFYSAYLNKRRGGAPDVALVKSFMLGDNASIPYALQPDLVVHAGTDTENPYQCPMVVVNHRDNISISTAAITDEIISIVTIGSIAGVTPLGSPKSLTLPAKNPFLGFLSNIKNAFKSWG